MKLFFTFLLVAIGLIATAQPTLTNHQDYNIGDVYQTFKCDTTGISAGFVTGANITWNLSLNVTGNSTSYILDKSSANSAAQFPDASFVKNTDGANGYAFYQKTATELRGVASENGGSVVLKASQYWRFAVWPFTYNDSFADTSAVIYPTLGLSGTLYYTCNADGYGSLTVNGKTYNNVLRTFSEMKSFDVGNNPIEFMETTSWWDVAHKSPLLSISRYELKMGSNPPAYSVSFLDKEVLVGIPDINSRYANITAQTRNGRLTLAGELGTGKEYQLHLYNTAGQPIISTCFRADGQQFSTPVPEMPCGIYYIHLQERGDAPGYIKFLHQ